MSLNPFLNLSIARAHHWGTETVFDFVFFQEGLEFVTCKDFRTVSLQHPGKPMVELTLQKVVDKD